MKVIVVIPTRRHLAPDGRPYHERARASVLGQQPVAGVEIAAVVAVDPSSVPLGQARVVNDALARAAGDVLAFCEDDDEWAPGKLAAQLPLLDRFDLVTCNQLEIGEDGAPAVVRYYPTPSGWLMRRPTWDRVGGFDPALQNHVDTDWLGRADRAWLRRVHLVQAGADPHVDLWRENMATSAVVAGPNVAPLVSRTRRPESITGRRARDTEARARSAADLETIRRRFGRVPW